MADGAARSHPNVRLNVTNIDDAMAHAARARLAARGNVRIERADVTDVPFADESFDVVLSHLMLHHVIDWRDALLEARVLRPGGVFLGHDLTDTRLARLIPRVDTSPHHLISASGLEDGLADAGFVDVGLRTSFGRHLMRFGARKPPGA